MATTNIRRPTNILGIQKHARFTVFAAAVKNLGFWFTVKE